MSAIQYALHALPKWRLGFICQCWMLAISTLALFALLTSLLDFRAAATENGVFGGPLGGTDIGQAYLPSDSGLYGALYFVPTTAPTTQDQNGNATSNLQSVSHNGNPAYFTEFTEGAALRYVYPIKPLGFTLATSFSGSYNEISQALSVNPKAVPSYKQGTTSGIGDSYSDIIYASHYVGLLGAQPGPSPDPRLHYGLTVAGGYAAVIPIGRYNYQNFPNVGHNTFISVPNVAATYLTGPNLSLFGDGTEISARFFFEKLYQNPTTLYQSGNVYDIDFAVTERWANVQFGLAGAYAQQVNSDICGGVTTCGGAGSVVAPYGNLFEKFFMGPVVAYYWPELDMTFKVKATFAIHDANAYNNNTLAFSLAKKLW